MSNATMVKSHRTSSKRTRLIDTAASLFNRHGYHHVGIDWVVADSGVAKNTLYRHFSSKEDLIVAVLRDTDLRSRAEMVAYLENVSSDPKERIYAIFDFLEDTFRDSNFFGCQFMRAAGEYSDENHPIFITASRYIKWMEDYLRDLLFAAEFSNPTYIAQEINQIIQGSKVVAFVGNDPAQARFAKVATKRILDSL